MNNMTMFSSNLFLLLQLKFFSDRFLSVRSSKELFSFQQTYRFLLVITYASSTHKFNHKLLQAQSGVVGVCWKFYQQHISSWFYRKLKIDKWSIQVYFLSLFLFSFCFCISVPFLFFTWCLLKFYFINNRRS